MAVLLYQLRDLVGYKQHPEDYALLKGEEGDGHAAGRARSDSATRRWQATQDYAERQRCGNVLSRLWEAEVLGCPCCSAGSSFASRFIYASMRS